MRGPLPVYISDPLNRLRFVSQRDGRAEGVQAGARRGGDRRRAELRAADDPRAGLAPELLHAPVQPDRHQRPRPAVPAVRARPRDAAGDPRRLPARKPRARDRDHVLQRPDELRPARRLRRAARTSTRSARSIAAELAKLVVRSRASRPAAAAVARSRAQLARRSSSAAAVSSRARTWRPRSSSPATTAA